MKNLTPEMITKAKTAKSAEELLELAKANGMEITADEAVTYFAQLNPKCGELDDVELDNVAGGCGPKRPTRPQIVMECPYCGTSNISKFDSLTREDYIRCSKCQRTHFFS